MNEKLIIIQNKIKYELQFVLVVFMKVSIKVYKDGKVLDIYIISIGVIKDILNIFLKVLILKFELQYGRVFLMVYGLEDVKVMLIFRLVIIVVLIDIVLKIVMVGQDMVIIVMVENKGKGDVYDVNVVVLVLNGFKFVSLVKSWMFKSFFVFIKMFVLIYVFQFIKVGKFDIGRVMVIYYDDQSFEIGKQKIIYFQFFSGIIVYGLFEIKVFVVVLNGIYEGNYVYIEVGKKVFLKFNVSVFEGDFNYEFIKNVMFQLVFFEGISGEVVILVGDFKVGLLKFIQVFVIVMENGIFLIGVEFVYQDLFGWEYWFEIGNVVLIDSILLMIIIKEVKIKLWLIFEEFLEYINKIFVSMNNVILLVEQIFNVFKVYLLFEEKKGNLWKFVVIVFLFVVFVVGVLVINYWNEVNRFKEQLMKKKQRCLGGFLKKEEEIEEDIFKFEEKKVI